MVVIFCGGVSQSRCMPDSPSLARRTLSPQQAAKSDLRRNRSPQCYGTSLRRDAMMHFRLIAALRLGGAVPQAGACAPGVRAPWQPSSSGARQPLLAAAASTAASTAAAAVHGVAQPPPPPPPQTSSPLRPPAMAQRRREPRQRRPRRSRGTAAGTSPRARTPPTWELDFYSRPVQGAGGRSCGSRS